MLTRDRLRWRRNGGAWQEEKYVCFEPARGLALFSHMVTGDPDYANLTQAVDFTDGLATTVRAQIGCWHSGWEVGSAVQFGTVEYGDLVPPFARRHHFSDDLLGRCYSWSYSKMLNSIHVYSSPESYSWTIFRPDGSGGPTWSSPCYIIKLRPDAYLLQWVEENCNGKQGLVVINPRLLHDGGFFYGVGTDGLLLNSTGAYGGTIAEYMIGSIIMLIRHFQVYRDHMKEHKWQRVELPTCITEHHALVIGLGDIGVNFAQRMKALGCSVSAVRRTKGDKPDCVDEVGTLEDLPRLLPEADFVALCLPNAP